MLKSSVPKSSKNYCCESCDFNTSRYSQYVRHLDTLKHQKSLKSTICQQISTNFNKESSEFKCNCGKIYKERTGLWRHKKICKDDYDSEYEKDNINENENEKDLTDKELIMMLIKENSELKTMMFKVIENGTNNNNNNTINSHNKAFNLNFFLNETCKDAMNISDFIDSVKLQVSDLENVGKVGYIEGISNIIIKNLKALDVNKRPVHCADQKREVMYVKDENIWEKEDQHNNKLRKAIRMIAHKNICMLKDYREKYPDCEEYDSKKNDQYNKIIYESMGGKGDDECEKYNKIIKKIAKEVVINKEK